MDIKKQIHESIIKGNWDNSLKIEELLSLRVNINNRPNYKITRLINHRKNCIKANHNDNNNNLYYKVNENYYYNIFIRTTQYYKLIIIDWYLNKLTLFVIPENTNRESMSTFEILIIL